MSSNPNQGGGNAAGSDYLDKAFNAVAGKFGGAQGKKIAANKGMSEKIVCCFFPLSPPPPFYLPYLPTDPHIDCMHTLGQPQPQPQRERLKWRQRERGGERDKS